MEENKYLKQLQAFPSFIDKEECQKFCMTNENLDVMQINIGKMCNLACKHCHVDAGAVRKEMMSKEVMEACLDVFEKDDFKTLDITGGAPEMNPNFQWLIEETGKRKIHTIVRTNLVILSEEGYTHLPELYAQNKVEIVASLPYYTEKDTDRQRGKGNFSKMISMLQKLNQLGYAKDPELVLNLVYNPGGAFLPPSQESLTGEFKRKLDHLYGVSFNYLFTITNNPIGRFGDFLERSGNLTTYMNRLISSFNPTTVEKIMCRSQLSVSWDGTLYDCDFNQALNLEVNGVNCIQDLKDIALRARKIVFGNHCYACTAGAGSSCGGATA
ncbi:arsenosugar biosynthesis radical SAM (seleno)protein ArsS [Desulfitobacterium sp. Sab5]|uniref:arsenosugar biosynthesis radical SAM (seleno)protein ArsS n=1 Tax=Desulfitobacterium nosdiversum TaxID=3375356 RepID=UPI003CF23DFC